jgi:hypothetical protein
MPNQNPQQPQQQQNEQRRNVPANEDQELNPIDYADEPPPVIKANTSGEGDDEVAGFQEGDENQGEGNRDADRNYREGIKKHLKKGNVEQEGKDAANALDDEEQREDLEEAEEAGRRGKTIH